MRAIGVLVRASSATCAVDGGAGCTLGGFQTHDIPTLVRLKLLQPLGSGAKIASSILRLRNSGKNQRPEMARPRQQGRKPLQNPAQTGATDDK